MVCSGIIVGVDGLREEPKVPARRYAEPVESAQEELEMHDPGDVRSIESIQETREPEWAGLDSGTLPDEPIRTWKSKDGKFSRDGRLVHVMGPIVEIEIDGKVKEVMRDRLSREDRVYIGSYIEKRKIENYKERQAQ